MAGTAHLTIRFHPRLGNSELGNSEQSFLAGLVAITALDKVARYFMEQTAQKKSVRITKDHSKEIHGRARLSLGIFFWAACQRVFGNGSFQPSELEIITTLGGCRG
jgi:hypothetical protein